ncbi:putative type VI secretion system effector [Xanthomonas oryzae]|uniref:putative type VI secretion system effector n=1 Tax=Xanthomonas oryzae TaxID=347 RepID=UPI0005CE0D2D|nr:putative type VI secretion system effector [Xanthomonas oryzae]AJQ86232.1 hypothetical protein BE73_03195 [Xanthomonas oryzae pv. oryzicola]
MENNCDQQACVIAGKLTNVKLKNTTAEIFFSKFDSDEMAATGVVAAALGLSGAAAGMASMSMDEMKEPVCQVSFDIESKHVEAVLWNWPFKEGDEVQAVVEQLSADSYNCFAVLDPKERIIVLYPHVSAGKKAHWMRVIKLSGLAGGGASFVVWSIMAIIGSVVGVSLIDRPIFLLTSFFLSASLVFLIGLNIGRRFNPFIEIAEPIFTVLGWKDVNSIDLRKITKAKKKPTDPPAMGDSYFRY